MATGYYEIKRTKSIQFHFVLKAGNHQVILSSQMYSAKSDAMDGIQAVQNACEDDSQYERRQSSNGKDYFVLKSKSQQIIGQSEMYESRSSMEKGIASVKKNGVSTSIKDLSDS